MQYPRLVESKTAANEVRTIAWNPGMDLLATVFSNETLTCSRLLSLQKVWSKQVSGRILSIAWRPDGRVLAMAAYDEKTKRMVCTLHDVEDGKDLNSIEMSEDISAIAWFRSPDSNSENEKDDPIKPKKGSPSSFEANKIESENFSHQLAHKQTRLNILLIATCDGRINFYALGLFYLGKISVSPTLTDWSKSRISAIHMSSCMRKITAVISTKSGPNTKHTSLVVINVDLFHRRSSEVLRVAKMYAKITGELEYLVDTMSAIKISWIDVLAGLDHKLDAYVTRRDGIPYTSTTFISADDLLQLLVTGNPSDNLEKFLADMSDKGLRKLCLSIEQTCQRVQNLIVKNAQKCCYHLHNDLNMLRGMSLWRSRFERVGLNNDAIVKAMRDVGSLVLKLTETQQVIDHSLKSTKSFFRWLISIACRMSGEQNNSISNDLNKTTQQDLQLITDFIMDNFDRGDSKGTPIVPRYISADSLQRSNFTLEFVGQYFKEEEYLSRPKYSFRTEGSNFWIDFLMPRHELFTSNCPSNGANVVFYPHNASRTLFQEFRNARQSVDRAFEKVPCGIKFEREPKPSNDIQIYLRDLVKNAPIERFRVEMDSSKSDYQHLALFQLKPSPVSKQYLLVQTVLDDNYTARMIAIEFQSLSLNTSRQSVSRSSASNSVLQIMDSCFYELRKSPKRLILTFLLVDQTAGDTIIVQLDAAKLVGKTTCLTKNIRDIRFIKTETIDKLSAQASFKIDIHSMPAHERKNEPGIMVKKIKGLVGLNMFASSSRGVIAFTSNDNKHLHLYELDPIAGGTELTDDEFTNRDPVDESLIDTEMIG